MTIKEFTRAYQTSDGRVFISKSEAEAHEETQLLLKAIRRACREACHDQYGPTRTNDHFQQRLAEELISAGCRIRNI